MRSLALIGMLMSIGLWAAGDCLAQVDERADFFESKIRPVLLERCVSCHGEQKSSGTLRLDSRAAMLRGGKSGPALVPGNSGESLLVKAIRRLDGVRAMPPAKDQFLRADQVADISTWIDAGAYWPADSARLQAVQHWAFEPLVNAAPPQAQDQTWLKTSIDSFIRVRQEAVGAKPSPMADKLTLIRRATFDLTGLPPTPEEIDAFVNDESPQAFQLVVDRLLASPAYGEQWGRHWLDVVRYADTAGETADYPVPTAWRYRNYVIDSFNNDKPYDEFIREQIAGDILASQTSSGRYAEQVTATGFLAISRRFGFDSENYHHLTIQDTIDTVGQTVLGISLGCARCHDHKFDAISMQDYYALYGIFSSSQYPFPGSEQKQQVRSLAPLLPPNESQARWLEFQTRLASCSAKLAKQNQSLSGALLRSLHDIDGDFEMQAAAAGGSNGVLVSPWFYSGKIAVTPEAQSPFKNCYASGKAGVSIPGEATPYQIYQAIHPAKASSTSSKVYFNLDFRVGAPSGTAEPQECSSHRLTVGEFGNTPAVEILFSSTVAFLKINGVKEQIAMLELGQWTNLQLVLDLKSRTFSGRWGRPGAVTEFSGKSFSQDATDVINFLTLDSAVDTNASYPAIEYDNLAIREQAIPPVAKEPPIPVEGTDFARLNTELQNLVGRDGDLEFQTKDAPPITPWNPGPNSRVTLSPNSQSPFRNVYPPGMLGVHLPNRAEYDGFGWSLPGVTPDENGTLNVSFDFRCANDEAGGDGSWRYYLGHGAGSSAAVELFFNGKEFFRRGSSEIEPVGKLAVGQWYQVQLTLNLANRTYSGLLASTGTKSDFKGTLAAGWDGTIDYSFIDSYGHISGVRPALDADNFSIGEEELRPLGTVPDENSEASTKSRLAKISEIREQLVAQQQKTEREKQELLELIANGPFDMAYGMAEGTPHNERLHVRGEPDQLGEEVPRGLPKALGGGPLSSTTSGSGRLELAKWLTSSENPLTARVMVNRIWQYHFGQGLVRTPNDFGVRGVPPSNPKLLDHLAIQFIRSGWSVKAMHRLIMLSATYQQTSLIDSQRGSELADQGAELYNFVRRRRLNAEEIRDSILAISGELDRKPARAHPFPPPTSWGFTQHNPFIAVYDHNHRSVYLMSQRLKRHPFLALFDGPDPNATTAQRLVTTVPTQALFFINDSFVHEKSQSWATRLLSEHSDPERRIQVAWRKAVGRFPSEVEIAEAKDFLTDLAAESIVANEPKVELRSLAAYLRVLFGSNEFLHID